MNDRKYEISRNDIYVGEVIKTDKINGYTCDGNLIIYPSAYFSLRSILFIVNDNGYAEDLIYNSPNYPILNITDSEECLNLGKESIVIQNPLNLGQLLDYFGYERDLTFDDVMKIRRRFFTGSFAKNNSELFGMDEIKDDGGSVIAYASVDGGLLNKKYFYTLDGRGDDLVGFLFGDGKLNAFRPSKMEGPVRRLKRF